MSKRVVKVKVKCGECKRWVYDTSYAEHHKKFVCKRCFNLPPVKKEKNR